MNDYKLGKLLAYFLRHRPDAAGITLDHAGWTDVDILLQGLEQHRGARVSRTQLERVVEADAKGRYGIEGNRIRAHQGHSCGVVPVETAIAPPVVLFHGTTPSSWRAITQDGGLRPMARHHVHLSAKQEAAVEVARRRRRGVTLLEVDSAAMARAGAQFFRAQNGVWLTSFVAITYLRELEL